MKHLLELYWTRSSTNKERLFKCSMKRSKVTRSECFYFQDILNELTMMSRMDGTEPAQEGHHGSDNFVTFTGNRTKFIQLLLVGLEG